MGLEGRTILTTRAETQSAPLREGLKALGATVVELPTIEIMPPESWEAVDAAVRILDQYDWLILTSANAVERFLGRLEGKPLLPPIAAIGSQTAKKLQEYGIAAVLVPENARAEGLASQLPDDLQGQRVLLPRALVAREYLPEALRKRGAVVDVVPVYRTKPPQGAGSELRIILSEKDIDCITLTSGSTARNLALMLKISNLSKILEGIAVAVIGPVTRESAAEVGLTVDIEAPQATMTALIAAIDRYFRDT